MGLMDRLLASSGGGDLPRPAPVDDFWYKPMSRRPVVGDVVTTAKALRVPVVLDCLTVLSQTISSLPWGVFRRAPNGDKTRIENHPLADLFSDPDGESTSHEFFAQMVFDLAAEGNAYYHPVYSIGRYPARLMRLEPHLVTVERLQDGSRRWSSAALGRGRNYVEGEVWHLRDTPLVDNLVGLSRITAGRDTIAALLSVMEYSASYVENDATPPLLIKHPGQFASGDDKRNFLNAISRWFGRSRKRPAVLEFGMDVVKLGHTPEEGQFLETRKELQVEATRLWRMPPHKVGILDQATFSNIEHQGLEFVTDTLTPWIETIEKSVNRFLIGTKQAEFFEFNVAGLLRGDIKARFDAYAQARQWGWLSVNEIRRMENLNPIGAGGNVHLQPMNMEPAAHGTGPLLDARGQLLLPGRRNL